MVPRGVSFLQDLGSWKTIGSCWFFWGQFQPWDWPLAPPRLGWNLVSSTRRNMNPGRGIWTMAGLLGFGPVRETPIEGTPQNPVLALPYRTPIIRTPLVVVSLLSETDSWTISLLATLVSLSLSKADSPFPWIGDSFSGSLWLTCFFGMSFGSRSSPRGRMNDQTTFHSRSSSVHRSLLR